MKQHLTLVVGETESDGYHFCEQCGGKTMLISAPRSWSVDDEPYKADERMETEEGNCVEISAELSAHFCADCRLITSLSFNQPG